MFFNQIKRAARFSETRLPETVPQLSHASSRRHRPPHFFFGHRPMPARASCTIGIARVSQASA
jgi:hypothetical protein